MLAMRIGLCNNEQLEVGVSARTDGYSRGSQGSLTRYGHACSTPKPNVLYLRTAYRVWHLAFGIHRNLLPSSRDPNGPPIVERH
jgi:hypothetical protein